MVVEACPDIFNHNIETVPRLYPTVRAEADYQRSLKLLSLVKELAPQMITKSGLMLGLGEESSEVAGVLNDLRSVGCDIVTLGQYLKPTSGTKNMEVVRFITPEEFADYRQQALTLGFKAVAAGPYVRSSYAAEELMQTILC
jgi:lipoic acid synthetase